jgi:hypothetical protein
VEKLDKRERDTLSEHIVIVRIRYTTVLSGSGHKIITTMSGLSRLTFACVWC